MLKMNNIGVSVNQFITVEETNHLSIIDSIFDKIIIHNNYAFDFSAILDFSAFSIEFKNLTF
jgi:hypothetical protein